MERGPNKWIRWPPFLSEKLRENPEKAARTPSVSRSVVRSRGVMSRRRSACTHGSMPERCERERTGRSVGKRGMICGASARGRASSYLPPARPWPFRHQYLRYGRQFPVNPIIVPVRHHHATRRVVPSENHIFLFSPAERPNIREALARLSLLKSNISTFLHRRYLVQMFCILP